VADAFENEELQALKWPYLIGGGLFSLLIIEVIYYFKKKREKKNIQASPYSAKKMTILVCAY